MTVDATPPNGSYSTTGSVNDDHGGPDSAWRIATRRYLNKGRVCSRPTLTHTLRKKLQQTSGRKKRKRLFGRAGEKRRANVHRERRGTYTSESRTVLLPQQQRYACTARQSTPQGLATVVLGSLSTKRRSHADQLVVFRSCVALAVWAVPQSGKRTTHLSSTYGTHRIEEKIFRCLRILLRGNNRTAERRFTHFFIISRESRNRACCIRCTSDPQKLVEPRVRATTFSTSIPSSRFAHLPMSVYAYSELRGINDRRPQDYQSAPFPLSFQH